MSSEFIHSIFSNLRKAQNAEKSHSLLNKLQTQAAINKVSKAGVNAGDNYNGFASLNGTDDVVSAVAGSTPAQITGALILAELTSTNNSEISSKILKDVSSSSDIQTLTGSSDLSGSGLLDDVVTSASPEAQAKVLTDVLGASTSEVQSLVGKNVDLSSPLSSTGSTAAMDDYEIYAQLFLTNTFNDLFSTSNSLSSLKSTVSSTFLTSALNVVAKNAAGYNSIMDNVVESNLQVTENALKKIITPESDRILQDKKDNIIKLIASKQYVKAANIVASLSNLSYNEVFKTIQAIDVSPSKNLVENVSVGSIPGRDLSKLKNVWQGRDTPESYFNNSFTHEREIINELGNIERDVTEVVIFSTNTPNNVSSNASDLQRLAVANGKDGTGYHYVFTRSGDIQRGRPVDNETPISVLLPNNHHERSVIITLVGGIDIEAGKGINYRDYYSASSYTQQQIRQLKLFLKSFYAVKPGIQVFGASQVNRNHAGPHIDIDAFIANSFKKKNKLNYDPSINPPLERKDLV